MLDIPTPVPQQHGLTEHLICPKCMSISSPLRASPVLPILVFSIQTKTMNKNHLLTIRCYLVLCNEKSKRIFLLGPSHHYYLSGCALTRCDSYETPLGALDIDKATTAELHRTGKFETMSIAADEDEHSLEMHLPYIYASLSR